jgi:formimidoylglutamate deiminase
MEPQRLFASSALLPGGWADDVSIEISAGRVTSVTRGAAGEGEPVGVLLPGMPNLHSHAFQRGMAGLTEYRGPAADNFWSWRSLMYRFVGRMTPDDFEAVTTWAFVEMLEAGFTRVGEFHYVHHDVDGRPYADVAELTSRVAAAADRTGIMADSAAHPLTKGSAGSCTTCRASRGFSTRASASSSGCRMQSSASRRIRCAR